MVLARRARGRRTAVVAPLLAGCVFGALLPVRGAPPAHAREPRREITLIVDGRYHYRRTCKQTVAAALRQARIDLDRHDEVQPPLLSPIYHGMTITVSRITTREITLEERLPYRIKLARTTHRFQRHPVVKVRGRAGRARSTYRVTYRDGVPVRRERIGTEVLQPAVDQVVQLGRNRVLSSRGIFGGRRVFRMIATAYDPGPLSCGPRATGRTCLGLRAGHGIVAVDPKVIPLRTRLYIEGYGHAIAGDVGSAIKGNRIDLGYASRRAALRFGRRPVTVYILD